ncbi:biosynthetic arginine decarboxylase [Synechococcus moorigangaii CMS01]|nr:biosynthetic arginine decarboxylase [Synechococcus moorigangaii CMS01]
MNKTLGCLEQAVDTRWTVADSETLYQVRGWGEPYFSINEQGHVQVSPLGEAGVSLDLFELVESLKQRDIGLPFLIRFPDILRDRIERLHHCFGTAIARYDYPNHYRGVYPVKCNQQRHLVEDLVELGRTHHLGLEAGSKPELMIAIAMLEPDMDQDRLLICNGYKDQHYIETALLATQLGHQALIVIEQPEELDLVIRASQSLGIRPMLGIRAKLASRGIGRWGGSSGDRAKFGLTIPQILRLVEKLQAVEMLDCLQLLHYHIGSQLSSISVVKAAIREASQIYVELVKLGAPMGFLDVGGGLAVDYSGSKNNFPSSKNYNMQNYANDVVATVQDTCDETNIPVPVLVSESGRAIASHQAVLIFDVLGSSAVDPILPPKPDYKEHLVLRNLRETYDTITPDNYQENYHDAVQFKDEAISLFNLGYLSLGDRANAEELYWSCCQKIFSIIQRQASIPEDFEELWQNMATLYYVNLSVFQSVPDSWAIDQLFPIMPIHRLDEEPTKKGILADLTCDSDGRINRFIDTKAESKNLLELHSPNGKPYYLGLFLMGAYQEIMGNLHNLFGDTHVVHVRLTDDGYHLEHLVEGDTIKEVLQYVQYDVADLLETMRCRTEKALSEKRLTLKQSQLLINHYRQSLESYTYLH